MVKYFESRLAYFEELEASCYFSAAQSQLVRLHQKNVAVNTWNSGKLGQLQRAAN